MDIPLEFSDVTGAITELKTNNIQLMAISNAGDDTNKLNLVARLRFVG